MTDVAAVSLAFAVSDGLVSQDMGKEVVFEGAQVTLVLAVHFAGRAGAHALVLGEV